MKRLLYVFITAPFLVSCGGGGSATPPASGSTQVPNGPTTAAVNVRLSVPAAGATTSSRLRRIFTVADNTKGAKITVYAHGDRTQQLDSTTFDVSSSSPLCKPDTGDTGRSCSTNITAAIGDDDFVIQTYDQAPATGGSIPAGANELSAGVVNQTITAGSSPTISATLAGVLSSLSLSVTPNGIHTLFPITMNVGVYGLDADADVIIGNYVDANGNPLTVSVALNNNLSGALQLSFSNLTASTASGIPLIYAPSGEIAGGAIGVTASATGIPTGTTTLTANDPTFTAINDTNLSAVNHYYGIANNDCCGDVFYSTAASPGGVDALTISSGVVATPSPAPFGGTPFAIGDSGPGNGTLYVVDHAANVDIVSGVPPNVAPQTEATPAPIPNGGEIAVGQNPTTFTTVLWYESGTSLVGYDLGGAPRTIPLGASLSAGVKMDGTSDVWLTDNTPGANKLDEYSTTGGASTLTNQYPIATTNAFDVLPVTSSSGGSDLFISNRDSGNPEIVEYSSSGTLLHTFALPAGTMPAYLSTDNTGLAAGVRRIKAVTFSNVVWFSFLDINSNKIGIGRIDLNTSPPSIAMALDPAGGCASSGNPGAITQNSSGTVYVVEDGACNLWQVTP